MFCIKCGAKLADSEAICPLCNTPVYNPYIEIKGGDKLYPQFEKSSETVSRSGIMFILTGLFLIPIILSIVCDLSISGNITWSGYVVASLLLLYIITILPIWFVNANPVIFVPCDFASIAIFLLYIEKKTGGTWFLKFALPETVMLCVIVTAVITIRKYVSKGALYVYGSACIAIGLFNVMTEYLINETFNIRDKFIWSYYPLITFAIIGALMITVAICKPMRESLKKKFFI